LRHSGGITPHFLKHDLGDIFVDLKANVKGCILQAMKESEVAIKVAEEVDKYLLNGADPNLCKAERGLRPGFKVGKRPRWEKAGFRVACEISNCSIRANCQVAHVIRVDTSGNVVSDFE
jgi:hypothetical protein